MIIGAVVGIAPSLASNRVEPCSAFHKVTRQDLGQLERYFKYFVIQQTREYTESSSYLYLTSLLAFQQASCRTPKRFLCALKAMGAEHLLKVPRSDSGEYVLVNVKQDGSKALDLRLVATDGSDVYVSESRLHEPT